MMGGCDITDSMFWLQDNYPQHSYHRIWGTTLGSLYSNRGKISYDIDKWYHRLSDVEQNSLSVKKIHKEVCLKDHISSCVVDKDTWIIVSMLYESSTRFYDGLEHLTIIPELQINGKDRHGKSHLEKLKRLKFPSETYELINDKKYATSVYDSELAKSYLTKDKWLEKYSEELYSKFGNKIIYLNLPPARKFYNRSVGIYYDLPTVDQYAYRLGEVSGMGIENYTWEYHAKQADLVYKYMYKRCFQEKIETVNIDWKDVIADDHHRNGRSPLHFTQETASFLGMRIKAKIEQIIKG